MTDDSKLKKPTRKDRIRAKKKSFKLSEKQVEMIRSQKGKMSIRQICEWYKKKHHNIHTVSIYDLINSDLSEEELENLDPKKVRYD